MQDWHLRDEVFGSARKSQRWRSARWLFGAMSRPHGVENSSDDIELGHFANHAQLATTARTYPELDIENLFESRHPTPRRTPLWLGSIGAGGTTIGCPGLDDKAAVSGVRCEYAVISQEMRSWARYQGRQTGDEVVRFEQYVRRSISMAASTRTPPDHPHRHSSAARLSLDETCIGITVLACYARSPHSSPRS